MAYYLFSTVFFLSLLISDYLQILQKRILIIIFSIAGYGGIVTTLFFLVLQNWSPVGFTIILFIKILFLVLSLLLLIYLLFFEIPLSPQYKDTKNRSVINHGSYGIVRHPAFYPFLLVSIALSLFIMDWNLIIIICYMNLLNFLLITVEDLFLFPKIFINYSDYKNQVPFLFPKIKIRCKKV